MIVRLLNEGQFRVDDELARSSTRSTTRPMAALEASDEEALDRLPRARWPARAQPRPAAAGRRPARRRT